MATFLVSSLTADFTFVQFNVLIWWKLLVSLCYYVEYIIMTAFHRFLNIFYISQFHKVMWLHSQDAAGKMTPILLQIPFKSKGIKFL